MLVNFSSKKNNSHVQLEKARQGLNFGDVPIYSPQEKRQRNRIQLRSARKNHRNSQNHLPTIPHRIQRYHIVTSNDYQLGDQTTFKTQNLDQRDFSSEYVTESRDLSRNSDEDQNIPDLKVSDDGKMAIENTTAQPKVFYATDAIVNSSNEKLAQVEAQMRLKGGGGSMRVPQDPEHPDDSQMRNLTMVQPAKEVVSDEGQTTLQVINGLDVHECVDVIKSILGVSYDVSRASVFAHSTQQESEGKSEFEPFLGVAKYMTNRGYKSNKNLASNLDSKSNRVTVANADKQATETAYKNLASQSKNNISSYLGINQYASPDVGEGYSLVSFNKEMGMSAYRDEFDLSPDTDGSDSDEYLRALQQLDNIGDDIDIMQADLTTKVKALRPVWGNHYAGVVAKSGKDNVTLENYNRDVEGGWEVDRIFNNLYKQFEDFRQLVRRDIVTIKYAERPKRKNLITDFQNKAQTHQVEISHELQEAITEAADTINRDVTRDEKTQMMYFAMYGGKQGQSFHEQFKGMSANAMTLRVRESTQQFKKVKKPVMLQKKNQFLSAFNFSGISNNNIKRPLKTRKSQISRLLTAKITEFGNVTSVSQGITVLSETNQLINRLKEETTNQIITLIKDAYDETIVSDYDSDDINFFEDVANKVQNVASSVDQSSNSNRKKKATLNRLSQIVTGIDGVYALL